MSFFKDLKDDMPQSGDLTEENVVDGELETTELADDETVAADDELVDDELVDESLLEDYLDGDGTDAEEMEDEFEEVVEEEPEQDAVASVFDAEPEEAVAEDRTADVSQVTIITKGTTINGSIISDCSLDVMGTINGDIECLGKLSISGNVVGNSVAADVFVNAKRLEGNIDSEGTVKIGLGTVVIGDIKAGSGVIAGAVKGELDIQGPVVIDSTAIIKGNIKAKTVQMNNGAVVEGFCSLSYSTVNIDDIFE